MMMGLRTAANQSPLYRGTAACPQHTLLFSLVCFERGIEDERHGASIQWPHHRVRRNTRRICAESEERANNSPTAVSQQRAVPISFFVVAFFYEYSYTLFPRSRQTSGTGVRKPTALCFKSTAVHGIQGAGTAIGVLLLVLLLLLLYPRLNR